jgi:TDG/mug DNA glycosylase family protein
MNRDVTRPAVREFRPTARQIRDAYGQGIDDVIAPGLKVLFVGINPGLYTAAIGHHFGRPGNRFWPALYAGGFTPRLYSPFESRGLLKLGYGITNLVNRATARADELSGQELRRGATTVAKKVRRYGPKLVAVVGIGSYRVAFDRPKAILGRQPEPLEGAVLWTLPNPSGLNAHYQPGKLKDLFAELREASG